ncbi:ABC transporter ATP-binding protein [soil metagenome]
MRMTESMLEIRGLEAWYGESHVLHGVSFDVPRGQVVSLVGRNGAGKTTIMRSIMGLVRKRRGSVQVGGTQTIALKPRQIARLGVGYVPEERGIFASLSVRENLMLPLVVQKPLMSMDEILALFPNLQTRMSAPGTKLSGGEQQMLAIARVLRTGAPLLLLDEPTEGLAPVVIQQIETNIARLRERGYTIVLIEQNVRFAWSLTDHFHVIEQGRVVDSLRTREESRELAVARLNRYLGV